MDAILHDELGPAKILQLYAPELPLRAFVVVDNTALGPAIGGVRISPSVTIQEVRRLARTMTLKNSIAGLPHGGAKAGIVVDPHHPRMEEVFRTFARLIGSLPEYIPGPDMGCDELAMAWIHDEIGRSCGLPEEIGGLPLDKLGATGFGVAICAEVAAEAAGVTLQGARMAVQGFGNVGRAAARFLSERGAVLVAASDSGGTLHNPSGLALEPLLEAKRAGQSVTTAKGGEVLDKEAIFALDCEILIPAANPDVITAANQQQVRAKLILEGANIPVTGEAETALAERGVLVLPDFIANAGGVIMAAAEVAGRSADEAFAFIENRLRANTGEILDRSRRQAVKPRQAAASLARERVLQAMRIRPYTFPPRQR